MAAIPRNTCLFGPSHPWASAAALLLGLLLPVCAQGQGPVAKRDGLVIPVPNVITGNTASLIGGEIKDVVERRRRKVEVIIFDFNHDGLPSTTTEAEPCIALKNLIQSIREKRFVGDRDIVTVAYVRNEVS